LWQADTLAVLVVSGTTPVTVQVYVHVSPEASVVGAPVPVGALSVQPAKVSVTATCKNEPVPVFWTVTVKRTSAPPAPTTFGVAVFWTAIV
jgi:hypothetical protein